MLYDTFLYKYPKAYFIASAILLVVFTLFVQSHLAGWIFIIYVLAAFIPFSVMYFLLSHKSSNYIRENHNEFYLNNKSFNSLLPASVFYDKEGIKKLNDPDLIEASSKIRSAVKFMMFSFLSLVLCSILKFVLTT